MKISVVMVVNNIFKNTLQSEEFSDEGGCMMVNSQ